MGGGLQDGIAVDRIVGFEELGGVDDFKTEVMARRIAKKGIIVLVRVHTPCPVLPATHACACAHSKRALGDCLLRAENGKGRQIICEPLDSRRFQ